MAELDLERDVPPLYVRSGRSDLTAVSGTVYAIGRNPMADIALDDPRVSWLHAIVRVVGGTWVLEDRDSTNGTWLGSERITRLEITGPCLVRLASPEDGAVIRFEPRPAEPYDAPTMLGPGAAQTAVPEYGVAASPEPWPQLPGPPPQPARAPAAGAVLPAGPVEPPAGSPGQGPAPSPGRYLKGQCPDGVRVGETFSVLASIVRDGPGNAPLKPFYIGPEGQDVLLVLHAPGFEVLSVQRQVVRVPFAGDSEPVMFELRADSPGPRQMSITAWLGGTYLGELALETTAARYRIRRGRHRDTVAAIDTTAAEGAVSLVVRYDPVQNAYRFEFRDEDNPEEVASHLAYEPGPRVEQLVAVLELLARGKGGYTQAETRDYLVNAGAGLWRELIPAQLREQFWDRQHRIAQLTILADRDTVPWELLYPLDRGHDCGFLVEQFPVTRLVFGRRPSRSLSLFPAWFVLPDGSPSQARDEVDALLRLFQIQPLAPEPVIGALTPLLDLIRAGNFGLLHFACHNAFDPASGSAISLDRRQFTPIQLNTAAIGRALAASAPTVFINACRSAGASPSYHQLDGWACKFLEAGAAAFIGSLWAVRDSTARDFASELYNHLRTGAALGDAVMRARLAAAATPGDPTWLAYAVYGDPRATLR
jgi:hypothetical protein